ncbi:MAG: hydantoinase/oxoprolinase family protein [Syntrophobacteraceae bacterium]|nr:hydantoinase/oxoprolinase family protein [Syntrophobacteraceae bacterium]
MGYKVGIDVGGTFTDFLLVDEQGTFNLFKTLSTPKDPSIGVTNGLNEMAVFLEKSLETFLSELELIVHGTTITTNAVLTRNGAKTAFITTKGFRDVLNMRRGLRDRQYDGRYNPPPPIVKRRDIFTVEERIDCQGNVVTPLNTAETAAVVETIKQNGYEAVGVSTLFSFLNPENEKLLGGMLRDGLPDQYISLSSEILPQVRMYERNSSVALNAYVGPILSKYIQQLEKRLLEGGFQGNLLIMQSNGGVMSPEVTSRFAVNTLLSGPAGGPVAGLFFGAIHGLGNLITVDMGGTSFDACLIREAQPSITIDGEIGGYRVALPTLYIETLGAGGGSIASVDGAGMLQVGPESAGADPGPACYGKGGTNATVTDADLILGYLDPDYFHGGDMKLDKMAATRAIEENVAKKLGVSVNEGAAGIYNMVNINMSLGVNLVSVAKGYDPRFLALVVAGGAGPIHAAMIAKDQDIPLILIPRGSSVFCAAGMLMSDLKHDYVRTHAVELEKVDCSKVAQICTEMLNEATATLRSEGIPEDRILPEFKADMRYLGQFNEVSVSLPMSAQGLVREQDMSYLLEMFHARHDALYGYSMAGAPTELINLRLQARGETVKPTFKPSQNHGPDASKALKNNRQVFFDKGFVNTPVYDGLALHHGNMIFGPAIVEEPTTTIVVPPDYNLQCDTYDNYIMYPKNRKLDEIIGELKAKM